MKKIKIGKKELKIKYGYEVTVKERVVSKVANFGKVTAENGEVDLEKVEDLMAYIPEMLLVGLQYYHKDEYGYDYLTGDGKQEQLSKVYELLDGYFDEETSDMMSLFNTMQEEMLQNGFLASLYRKEAAASQ